MPDETIKELQEADLFRALQPKRFNGLESDPVDFFDAVIEIGKVCGSTAWVLGVVAVHSWQLALFPLQAQLDVWGQDDKVLISSSYAPTGTVERVEGGYILDGTWFFSSGSDHCRWVFLGGVVPREEGAPPPPDMRTFLLPSDDYEIVSNRDAFKFMDALIASEVHFETAGSLWGGKRVWVELSASPR